MICSIDPSPKEIIKTDQIEFSSADVIISFREG